MATKNERLEFFLQRIDSIPSLPNIVGELLRLIDNPMVSTRQIEDLLAKDQGLTLRVLRLANSAYYAIPGGAKTLGRAITYLGINAVKQLVISASVIDAFKKLDGPQFSLVEFWKHSFGVAICAEIIGKQVKTPDYEEAFVAGLIHDVGKLALLMIDKETFLASIENAKQKGTSLHQAELDSDGPAHAYWGSVLAKKWKLPPIHQGAIQFHHSPNPKARTGITNEMNSIIDIVFLSNQLIHQLKFGNSGYDAVPELNKEILERIGISADPSQAWLQKVKNDLSHADMMVRELFK